MSSYEKNKKTINVKADGNTMAWMADELKDLDLIEYPELCVDCKEPLVTAEEQDRGICMLCYESNKDLR